MSKRPITYSPDTPERPAKRRQVSRSAFSGSTYTGYEQPPESDPMEEDEVTSSLKRDREYYDWYDERRAKRQNTAFTRPAGDSAENKRKADGQPVSDAEFLEMLKSEGTLRGTDIPVHIPKMRAPIESVAPTEIVAPTAPRVVPGIPEPSTAGYKMSNTSKMATTQYKYLHVDSSNRLTHETNSKLMVNFGGLPLENVKRVAVLKCAITNTHHNVYQSHDSVEFNVRLSTGETRVKLTVEHGYYTIAEIISALNTKLQAYTNANATLQTAVRDLEFVETAGEKVKIKVKDTPATVANTDVSYALICDHLTDHPNTLLLELGFDKTYQTFDPSRYADYMNEDLHDTAHYGQLILPSQNFYGRLFYQPNSGDSRPTSLEANHRYIIENAKGFYLCSSDLTAGGNVLKTQILGNGRASVAHDDHLLFIPNKALRDEYNLYESNVLEWIDVPGDIQTFDLEIRTHTDKVLYSTSGASAPPFLATLIFECETERAVFGTDTLAYHREAYLEAHRQN